MKILVVLLNLRLLVQRNAVQLVRVFFVYRHLGLVGCNIALLEQFFITYIVPAVPTDLLDLFKRIL